MLIRAEILRDHGDGASKTKPTPTRNGMVDAHSRNGSGCRRRSLYTCIRLEVGLTTMQGVTKTVGFSGDAVVGRENVMDSSFHLHSVVLSLKTMSQYHKLTIQACHCSPIAGAFRGTGVEA